MSARKGALGIAMAITCAAAGLSALAGVGYAAESYTPTVLGNSSYSNQTDAINDYQVQGIDYTAQIASQNSDTVAEAESLSATIGTKSDAASPIVVTNSLGKTIKAFTFRSDADTSYPANMLSASLKSGDSACWYYTYDYAEKKYTNATNITINMPENYTLQVTFDDGTTAEFHNLNMNAVRTINLCYSEDYKVYYAERTTITNHTPDPNLYYEVNLANYTGSAAEFDYHVNSGGRMGELAITAARGGGWDEGQSAAKETIENYRLTTLPLYGQPTGDYTDGNYDYLHWNSNDLTWRKYSTD